MAWRIFKKKPAARIKIGNTFLGKKISAVAEGYCIYKEWDAADKRYYYWEEWELRGFNDYDSWIEYDHYTQKVSLYEPVKPLERNDPVGLKPGDFVRFTPRKTRLAVQAKVSEAGIGIIERLEGKFTYYVFEGDPVAYAECIGPGGSKYSIEKYNEKEFDIYRATELNTEQQKELLGRVVSPSLWRQFLNSKLETKLWVLFGGGFLLWSFIAPMIPQYETYCTPRSVVPPASTVTPTPSSSIAQPGTASPQNSSGVSPVRTAQPSSITTTRPDGSTVTQVSPTDAAPTTNPDPIVSQDSTQTCYRRTIYGGGGGGVGK